MRNCVASDDSAATADGGGRSGSDGGGKNGGGGVAEAGDREMTMGRGATLRPALSDELSEPVLSQSVLLPVHPPASPAVLSLVTSPTTPPATPPSHTCLPTSRAQVDEGDDLCGHQVTTQLSSVAHPSWLGTVCAGPTTAPGSGIGVDSGGGSGQLGRGSGGNTRAALACQEGLAVASLLSSNFPVSRVVHCVPLSGASAQGSLNLL